MKNEGNQIAARMVLLALASLGVAVRTNAGDPRIPRPVAARVNGFPVYTYGDFNVYAVSPTYDPTVVIQKGNRRPWQPVIPKKSWQIKGNMLGLTPTRSPSSHATELEQFHPLHFIDDDPATQGFAGKDRDTGQRRATYREPCVPYLEPPR